jgi:protein-disulfide isomerase
MQNQKLLILALLLNITPVMATPGIASEAAELKAEMPGDKALGNPNAPVTLIEYASLSCSHCAAFHFKVLPTIQKEYISTGKVRYMMRDYPLNNLSLFASLVAYCSGKQGGDEKYFKVLNEIIAQQSMWAHTGAERASLLIIATDNGVDGRKLTTCMDEDKALEEKIIASRKDAQEKLGINKAPSYLINGELVESIATPEEARKLIDAALAKAAPQTPQNISNKGAKL